MMDRQRPPQPSLFYRFNLEQRVPSDNPLRVIAGLVDFDFVYHEVEALYGAVGKPSIPPPVILKLMFLLAFENVRSERALFAALPLRLDWLWFLGMDLDSEIPNHSVLSKARARWGAGVFRRFFDGSRCCGRDQAGCGVTATAIQGTSRCRRSCWNHHGHRRDAWGPR